MRKPVSKKWCQKYEIDAEMDPKWEPKLIRNPEKAGQKCMRKSMRKFDAEKVQRRNESGSTSDTPGGRPGVRG